MPVSFTVSGDGGGPVPPPPAINGQLLVSVSKVDKGDPIENAVVQVQQQSAKTNRAGKAEFTLPAGKYIVHATADGFGPGEGEIEVKSGERPELIIFLPTPPTPTTGSKFSITVLEFGTEKPIKDATIEVKDIQGNTADMPKNSATTGADGKAELDLPPNSGKLSLTLSITAATFEEFKGIFKLPDDGFVQVAHLKLASRVRSAIFSVQDTVQHQPLQAR